MGHVFTIDRGFKGLVTVYTEFSAHVANGSDQFYKEVDLGLGVSVVSVFVVLVTQLISDIGYVYLNPRISVS